MSRANMNSTSQALEGVKLAAKDVCDFTVSAQDIYIKPKKKDKIRVVVCGCAGYESMIGCILGENLADAVVIEPTLNPYSIMRTAISVDSGRGVLFICSSEDEVKSAVLAAGGLLEESGFASEMVYVHDNISVENADKEYSCALNGSFFFCVKIAGAAAARGLTLKETYYVVRKARNCVKSAIIALVGSAAGQTAVGRKTSEVSDETEIECLVFQLLQASGIRTGDSVGLFINGIGGAYLPDLGRINFLLSRSLTEKGITIHDMVINPAPLDAKINGASVSLILLTDELRNYYDAPCSSLYYRKN